MTSISSMSNWDLGLYCGTGILIFWLLRHWISERGRKYPPGPRGWPFIGNLLDLEWDVWVPFTRWKAEFGALTYLSVFGKPMLILNSHKVVAELFERRAAIYSDRPRNILASEVAQRGLSFVLVGHTEWWRRSRRAAHEAVKKSVAPGYFYVQTREALVLVQGLLEHNELWREEFNRSTASAFTTIIYGTPPLATHEDPRIRHLRNFSHRISDLLLPGKYLVEFFPWMTYLPSSITKWKRDAEEMYFTDSSEFGKWYDDVKNRLENGDKTPSFTGNLIETEGRHSLSRIEAVYLGANMFAAGSETSSTVREWFLKAMILHPEVQIKAQMELDVVVGRQRVPTFGDWDDLPYVHAIIKEVLRLWPVAPYGIPHYIHKDDIYDGYFIPGGTTVFANIWGLNRDPDVYGPDADEFKPERHLDGNDRLVLISPDLPEGHVSFGFGRRICVGRHVALYSLFIDTAMILWATQIVAPKDADGRCILPDRDDYVNNGLIVRPAPFKCLITPRFPEVRTILERTQGFYQQ